MFSVVSRCVLNTRPWALCLSQLLVFLFHRPKLLKPKTDQNNFPHRERPTVPKLSQMDVHGANRSTSHDGIFQKLVVLFGYSFKVKHPIESTYSIFTYIWLILMVPYGKCSSKYIPYMDSMSMVKSNISKQISPKRPEEHLPPPKRPDASPPFHDDSTFKSLM